ncbi:hypothetical protein P3T73_16525 [Kiritimatiellota bacterium B12222]|nr:hypothetical protein P3T73_16525 [Kiritimatiellota bacterium B12222]
MKTYTPLIHSISRSRRFLMVLAGISSLLIASLPLSAGTIYSEDFSSGREGWYNSSSAGGLLAGGGEIKSINSWASFLGHFPSTTLAVNETMTVSFDLKVDTPVVGNYKFRMGVMDSGGVANQATGDNYGSIDPSLFTNYGGYRVNTNVGDAAAGHTYFSERSGTGDGLLSNGMTELTNSENGVNLADDTWYTTLFTLTRTDATTINLSFSLNGVTLTDTDTTADTFTFDTLAFYEGNVTTATFVDNVLITTAVIPEPTTLTLMVGALLFGLYFKRRT